jgi:hypothetical protein
MLKVRYTFVPKYRRGYILASDLEAVMTIRSAGCLMLSLSNEFFLGQHPQTEEFNQRSTGNKITNTPY